jgi:hypothetical protein
VAGYTQPPNFMPSRIGEVYRQATPIVKTDNNQIGPFMALWVGGGGDVTLVPTNSLTPVLLAAVPAGTMLKIAFQGVQSTGTTATGLVGLG